MMGRIRVLPDPLVNQIAAGEVVERPASIVKELVENALDAEATRIELSIRDGGKRWIRVTDNGIGLGIDDAKLAFQRHATSKLRDAESLTRIETLGFRGEALPSIAAVARVRMRTRTASDPIGTEVSGEGNGIDQVTEVACPEGTSIEIADVFGLVPARQKFLKTGSTETGHIVRWLERIALARPDVHFELERDGQRALLFLPTSNLRERVVAVLPPSVSERMIAVKGSFGSASVQGFATPTELFRGTAGDIHIFVNARPVRDRLLLQAVRDAYRDALPPGRHPAAVLYLSVDPAEVDVNVHPAKWEVRFREPRDIFGLVREALVEALGLPSRRQTDAPRPTFLGTRQGTDRAMYVADAGGPATPAQSDFMLASKADFVGYGTRDSTATPSEFATPVSTGNFAVLQFVGQVMGTYLILEGSDGLLLLDQHAAHERVLFERMRQSLLNEKLERQALLVPVWIELTRSTADSLQQAQADLERAGFELEFAETTAKGGVRIGVRAVPAVLATRRTQDWQILLEETAGALRDPDDYETRDGIDAAVHGVLATAACHAAIRKGDRLEKAEVQGLLESLDSTLWFPNCPHGRPILWELSEAELERRFLRR